jgi:RNA polymerase sigma-70 factor (ECF subfamily)
MSVESHAIHKAAAEFIRDRHLLGAFVNGLLRDAHAAEDILQEVWALLSLEVDKGAEILNQAAWCRGVARNLIRRHWEKKQQTTILADSDVLENFLSRVEQSFARADTQEHFASARLAALDQCVASLPERSRQLLSLKYSQRATLGQIACETGQSFEAVKKALIRLRAALLQCVRRRLSREEWNT